MKVQHICSQEKVNYCTVTIADRGHAFGTTYFEQTFPNPVNEFVFPKPPDSMIANKDLVIKLWVANYVINDYTIIVTPSDWREGKMVYGMFSYR